MVNSVPVHSLSVPCHQLVKSLRGIGQSFAMQTVCSEVDDGYLLSGMVWEGAGTPAGDEDAVIGIGTYIGSGTEIVDEQADISQCMVFTFARGTDDGDAAFTLRQQEIDGFGLVVGFLVADAVQDMSELPAVFITEGVTVADDYVGEYGPGGCIRPLRRRNRPRKALLPISLKVGDLQDIPHSPKLRHQ